MDARRHRGIALASGPLLGAAAWALALNAGQAAPFAITLGMTVWCATWWLLEPVDAAVTALMPLALLPLLGVLDAKQVAQSYGNELILLLGGGFMLSRALERSGAHRRLALGMVRLFGGGSGRSLLYGFTAATGFISMWISNTATTLLMLPVALAILETYPDPRLRVPLVLAIAYAASIGGLGTPIGSPPNLVFMQVYEQTTGTAYGFLDWMKIGVPIVILLLPLMALWLGRGLRATPAAALPEIGTWTPAERRVLIVFALTALAWITREAPYGGWSEWLALDKANDASIALLAVVLLCVLPSGKPSGERLLDWQAAESIPWGALILFGGGIALATAFQSTGLSESIAAHLVALHGVPLIVLLLVTVGGVVMLSEIASNTATAVLLMPILAAASTAIGVEPALLMFPAVMAASIGFMLPVATAPNAIAYGTGWVGSRTMIREGFVLDLIGVAVLCAVCWVAFG